MDILREFLESSTIHGLSYISSAKVKHRDKFSKSWNVKHIGRDLDLQSVWIITHICQFFNFGMPLHHQILQKVHKKCVDSRQNLPCDKTAHWCTWCFGWCTLRFCWLTWELALESVFVKFCILNLSIWYLYQKKLYEMVYKIGAGPNGYLIPVIFSNTWLGSVLTIFWGRVTRIMGYYSSLLGFPAKWQEEFVNTRSWRLKGKVCLFCNMFRSLSYRCQASSEWYNMWKSTRSTNEKWKWTFGKWKWTFLASNLLRPLLLELAPTLALHPVSYIYNCLTV